MSKSFFPHANPTQPFWLSRPTEFLKHRTTEHIPPVVDVVIIGSGYAGTSVATNLQEMAPGLKLAMFEARDVCSGATGRNGGHIKPYCHRHYQYYAKRWGHKRAAEIINSEYEHLWVLKKMIEDNKIECDFILTRACDVYPEGATEGCIPGDLKNLELMMKNPDVLQELKSQMQVLYGDAARNISKNPTTEIAITYPAGSCWPWKLMTTLLQKCVDKGLNLQSNTPVTSVEKCGSKYLVNTARGTTLASKVVYCTNGYTKSVLPEFSKVLVPQRGVCTSMKPKDTTKPIPQLTHSYGLFSEKPINDYLMNRADGTIIVGGHMKTMLTKGNNPLEEMYDYADDTKVPEAAKEAFNENYMRDRFVTWKDTDIEVNHWTGILGYTNDYLPYVGELDLIGKENAYIVAGFHGHGMPRVWMSGKAVARCIAENKKIKDIEYTCPTAFYVTKDRLEGENVYLPNLKAHVQITKPKL